MTTSRFSVEALRLMVSATRRAGEEFVLNRLAVIEVLQAFIAGVLPSQDVVEWAEFFDVNEDVELEPDVSLPEILFELSSPEINGELDPDRARELIAILSNVGSIGAKGRRLG